MAPSFASFMLALILLKVTCQLSFPNAQQQLSPAKRRESFGSDNNYGDLDRFYDVDLSLPFNPLQTQNPVGAGALGHRPAA